VAITALKHHTANKTIFRVFQSTRHRDFFLKFFLLMCGRAVLLSTSLYNIILSPAPHRPITHPLPPTNDINPNRERDFPRIRANPSSATCPSAQICAHRSVYTYYTAQRWRWLIVILLVNTIVSRVKLARGYSRYMYTYINIITMLYACVYVCVCACACVSEFVHSTRQRDHTT